jgi:hypothetical protein
VQLFKICSHSALKQQKEGFMACLFRMKVEGKIEEGGKVEGLTIFPSFGTTLKREGMIIIAGSHNKYVSALCWTESTKNPLF